MTNDDLKALTVDERIEVYIHHWRLTEGRDGRTGFDTFVDGMKTALELTRPDGWTFLDPEWVKAWRKSKDAK